MTEMLCSRRIHPWQDFRPTAEPVGAPNELIDVTELARRLGIARSTAYAHSATFGAIRLGSGPPRAAAIRLGRGASRPAKGGTALGRAPAAGTSADAHPSRQLADRGPPAATARSVRLEQGVSSAASAAGDVAGAKSPARRGPVGPADRGRGRVPSDPNREPAIVPENRRRKVLLSIKCKEIVSNPMSKLIVFNNVSLDGYFTAANGDFSWAHGVQDPEFNAFVAGNASGGGRLIMGRITYNLMASYWPTPMAAKNSPVVAEGMNSTRKIVFSKTLEKVSWSNTTLM